MIWRCCHRVTDNEHNIYYDEGDTAYGGDHIRNRRLKTRVASLAYDLLSPTNVVRTLYENDDFQEFLAAVLDLDKDGERLYRSADPYGACSINISRPGGEQGLDSKALYNFCPRNWPTCRIKNSLNPSPTVLAIYFMNYSLYRAQLYFLFKCAGHKIPKNL